jgi:hypothetical protein
MKAIKFILILLLFLLPNNRESTFSGDGIPDKVTINREGKSVYAQTQYTSYTLEQPAIRQSQSLKVEPILKISAKEVASYVDSIYNDITHRIDEKYMINIIREETTKEKEARAYLFTLGASLLLSLLGIWVSSRTSISALLYVSLITFTVTIIFIFLKVPTIFSLL